MDIDILYRCAEVSYTETNALWIFNKLEPSSYPIRNFGSFPWVLGLPISWRCSNSHLIQNFSIYTLGWRLNKIWPAGNEFLQKSLSFTHFYILIRTPLKSIRKHVHLLIFQYLTLGLVKVEIDQYKNISIIIRNSSNEKVNLFVVYMLLCTHWGL